MSLKNYILESRRIDREESIDKPIVRRSVDHSVKIYKINNDDVIFTPVDKDELIKNSEANTMYLYALAHMDAMSLNQKYLGMPAAKDTLTTQNNPIYRIVINLRKYLEKVIKTNSKAENVETAQETLERVFVRFIEPFFLKITKNPKKKHDVDSHIVVPLQKYLTETGDLDKQTALFLKFFLSSDEFRKRVIDYVELATKFAAKFG